MIHEVRGGLWVHAHDLMADIPGREDSMADKVACATYLERRQKGATQQSALRAQSALAAALVRNLVVRKDSDVDQLAAAQQAIDRLLAFVPPRAQAIPAARLEAIVQSVAAATVAAFPDSTGFTALIAEERDPDTDACHRVVLRFQTHDASDPFKVASGVVAIHRALADATAPEEHRAILLVVSAEAAAE